MILFDYSGIGFYDTRVNKKIPDTTIEVSKGDRDSFCSQSPVGMTLGAGEDNRPKWVSVPTQGVKELSALAKITRDEAINSFVGCVVFDGSEFQASSRSKLDMEGVIRKAELQGYPDTDIRPWRLSDNSWRDITLSEIKAISEMVELEILGNWETVWSQFNIWDSGDKTDPFTIND